MINIMKGGLKKDMKFKKIMSVLASAVMLSSTIGFAAAAAYPEPFVSGGTADSAVIVGANAAVSDYSAAIDVQKNLQALVTTGTTTTDASISGEAVALFTGGTKIYVNDTLNAVKTVLTKNDLPTALKEESFSGNVDATITQTIDIGSIPRVTFKKQPTSSDDPEYALELSTNTANYLYNATATFNKAVNFSHADSEGESIDLFGNSFTVSSSTSATDLVLLQSAEKVSLDTDNPTADVTISGDTYTVELVSASDTAATIRITDSSGAAESKEISEAASKKINGITVAVTTADETNLKLSASVVAGSEKITLTDNTEIKLGEDDTVVDGTKATLTGTPGALTKLIVSQTAPGSDTDAIKAGSSFTDLVFKSVKLDFAGLNIPEDSTARETIEVGPNGDDKLEIVFTDHSGTEKTIQWIMNGTSSSVVSMVHDDDNHNITVGEGELIRYQEYVVVGNEDEGHLLKLSTVDNSSTSGTNNDYATFTDVFTGDTLTTTWSAEQTGTLVVGGKSYAVYLNGSAAASAEEYEVHLNYPDSAAAGVKILYPTIETSKGAKIMFYDGGNTVKLSSWDREDGSGKNLTEIKVPDGDGYTSIISSVLGRAPTNVSWNMSIGGNTVEMFTVGGAGSNSTLAVSGPLTFNVSNTATRDEILIELVGINGVDVTTPAIVIFEEKDDNAAYEAMIIVPEIGVDSDDGMGVSDVEFSWSNETTSANTWRTTMKSNSKITKAADLWGTIASIDATDSDQQTVSISYPDEQVYAQIYVGEIDSTITPGATGSSGAGGQVLIVEDGDVSSVAGKNLVVVGGSCINTVAAKILGSDTPLCTSAFTDATEVGAGEYIIKTVASPYAAADSGKVAMLVAGYESAETKLAVAKALEGAMSDVDTSTVYPETTTSA